MIYDEEALNYLELTNTPIPKKFVDFEPFEYYFEATDDKERCEFFGYAPEPNEEKDVLVIQYNVSYYVNDFWLDPNYSSIVESEYFIVSIYYIYQWQYNALSKIGGLAEDFPGEEDGISVACVAVTGTLGLFLASIIASIGALSDDDKANLFFYINKDFDNILDYDNQEKTIYVKIIEKTEKEELTRTDLTKDIEVISNIKGFKLTDQKIENNLMKISFKLEETKHQMDKGMIIFRYYYDYFTIENKMLFLIK